MGGRITMGPAGRDRRMRAGAKSRQPGASAESSNEHEVVDDERGREPSSAGPYTRSRQISPTRKRGRVPTTGRTPLKSRTSLLELVTKPVVQLVQLLITDFCTELLLQDLASVQDARSQTGNWSPRVPAVCGGVKPAKRPCLC